jgi:hypothetical protein
VIKKKLLNYVSWSSWISHHLVGKEKKKKGEGGKGALIVIRYDFFRDRRPSSCLNQLAAEPPGQGMQQTIDVKT